MPLKIIEESENETINDCLHIYSLETDCRAKMLIYLLENGLLK